MQKFGLAEPCHFGSCRGWPGHPAAASQLYQKTSSATPTFLGRCWGYKGQQELPVGHIKQKGYPTPALEKEKASEKPAWLSDDRSQPCYLQSLCFSSRGSNGVFCFKLKTKPRAYNKLNCLRGSSYPLTAALRIFQPHRVLTLEGNLQSLMTSN